MPLTHDWSSVFPGSIDSDANMFPLVNDTTPGAGDGDRVRVSHLHALKASLIQLENFVGESSPSDNSLRSLVAQVTQELFVDKNRIDTYLADGSRARPFKSIQDAVSSISDTSALWRITIAAGIYPEAVTLKKNVFLNGAHPDSVWIVPLSGNAVTWSAGASDISGLGNITCIASAGIGVAVTGGCTLYVYNCKISSSNTYGFTSVGSNIRVRSSIVISSAAHALYGITSGTIQLEHSYFKTISGNDIYSGVGTTIVLDGAVQSGSNSVSLNGTVSLLTPASFARNDSSVSGTSVKDALNTLLDGRAASLKSLSTTVDVAAATAPSTGQVLTATDSTHATWQTPSSGGGATELYVPVGATAGTYDSVDDIPVGAKILEVLTEVVTAYDGLATIGVAVHGTTDLNIQTSSQNNPSVPEVYETEPFYEVTALNTGKVRVTVGGLPTVGRANVVVHYIMSVALPVVPPPIPPPGPPAG